MNGLSREAASYSPKIPPAYWEAIKDFVLSSVADCTGRTPYSDVDLSLVTTRLALWCWQTLAMELTPAQVFRREVIDRFCAEGLPEYKEAARGNFRSQLLRMSEVLLDPRSTPRRLVPMKASPPSQPYTDEEIISLRSWAASQPTAARRTNAHVLLALGLGGGLSAREIGELRAEHVSVDELGVVVHVRSGRARTVPILREWEAALIARQAQLDGAQYVFRENHTIAYENLISGFVGRSVTTGVRPQSQRMRASWIVHHLSSGTPVVALMEAAGVESLEALTRYVRFVRPLSRLETRRILTWGTKANA